MRGRALLFAACAFAGILRAAEGAETWRQIRVAGECRQRGTTSTCLLRLPEREVRDLAVDVPAGDQDVGFRLYRAWAGTWDLETEGVWTAAPVSRHEIQTRSSQAFYGGPVRLELFGEVRPPRLAGLTAAVDRSRFAREDLKPAPKASRAVFPLESVWFPAAWPVRAEGARPGDVVRLELPDEVLGRLGRPYLNELRVATPEGQLPWNFVLDQMPRTEEPARARLVPADRPGWLRLILPAQKGPSYKGIQLTAPPRPLQRRVLVEGFGARLWTCVPRPPLPCRLVVGFLARDLPEILVEGGEDNPLPPLEVSVWRQTEHLVFIWPEQGPVRLLAGNGRISGQDVWLSEIDVRATERPWKPAKLGSEERLYRKGSLGGAIVSTLVVAGLCLREVRRRRSAAAALLLALLALLPAQAWGADVLVERPLEVPAAGQVRVPLDLETLGRLVPDQQWLRVIGPDGEELRGDVSLQSGLAAVRAVSVSPVCERAGTTTRCLLRLPAGRQFLRQLRVAMAGVEPGTRVGFQLATANEGLWKTLATGIVKSSPESVWRLPVAEPFLEGTVLRIELYGWAGPPRPVRVELDLAPASLQFEAMMPGTHRLVFGESFPKDVGRPRGNLGDDFEVEAEWPVRAPGVAAGGIVRLELPAEVYVRSGSLDRLRLETAGRQIPYALRTMDLAAPVARGRIPPGFERSISFAVSPALPLIAWRLETRKRVSVVISEVRLSQVGGWVCDPAPLSPCIAEPEYDRMRGSRVEDPALRVTHHGDPEEIDVTLLRQRHELVFVWPEGGKVRLLAGREGTAAPLYDLHAVQDRLLARPWQPARLGPVRESSASFRQVLLSATALILLAAVHRMMPRRSQPSAGVP